MQTTAIDYVNWADDLLVVLDYLVDYLEHAIWIGLVVAWSKINLEPVINNDRWAPSGPNTIMQQSVINQFLAKSNI